MSSCSALARLRGKGVPFFALLVGGGPLLGASRRLAERLGLADVTSIEGFVDDVAPFYRSADVFVLPSLEEGSGSLSLLEALQAGVAVVASRCDGIPEDVEEGEDALLVTPGDPEALAGSLARLLEDPALRRNLSRRARDDVRREVLGRSFHRGAPRDLSRGPRPARFLVRILDVSPRVTYPLDRGSAVRIFNLLRHLGHRHHVRQFSQAQSQDERYGRLSDEVRHSPSFSEYHWADRAASFLSEISERSWPTAPILSGAALRLRRPRALRRLFSWADVTLVEFPWQFDFCRRHARGPVVLASHNVEALKFPQYRSASGLPARRDVWLRLIEKTEARAVSQADLILAVSREDRQHFVERYGVESSRVAVIPNGAEIERYRPATADSRLEARRSLGLPDRPVVFFTGSDVPPNRAGLSWIRRLAASTDRFTFLVAGPVSRKTTEGRMIATGRVADISVCFRAADIFACPIRHGGGTKIKLLEALAAGLPTVAFPESTHGLDVRNEEHLLTEGADEEAWIAALHRLADDRAFSSRLGRAGAAHVEIHHDWARIAEDLELVLVRLLEGRAAPKPEPALLA